MAEYLIAYHQDVLEELRRKPHIFDLMKAEFGNYTTFLADELHRVVKERKSYNPDALGECNNAAPKPAPNASDPSMHDVQGGEGEQGVQLAHGATVILSACNTGRGEIKAEGVVGLARGFLLANASAAVVSLWSVDDGSTAALMRIKYEHLAQGCTVPQALRLAMLRLARRPSRNQSRDRVAGARVCHDSEAVEASQDGHQDVLEEAWKRPVHWAGFLVVGAATRLPTTEGGRGKRVSCTCVCFACGVSFLVAFVFVWCVVDVLAGELSRAKNQPNTACEDTVNQKLVIR